MNQKYIAFFDSGIGGITTLSQAIQTMPQENFLYYGDTRNVPYGVKSTKAVRSLVIDSVHEMEEYGIKALVLACNTATSAAAEYLRSKYQFPVIGMEPAIKPALTSSSKDANEKRVLLLSTELTRREAKMTTLLSLLDTHNRVDCLSLSELVGFAENLMFDGYEVVEYLKDKLSYYTHDLYGAVVLGCTHFIWYRDLLREILPKHVQIFDGNVGTVNHLKNILENQGILSTKKNNSKISLHFTGDMDENNIKILSCKLGLSCLAIKNNTITGLLPSMTPGKSSTQNYHVI